MAISINWGTKVISVPKADTTLIQASPSEIRELDLNTFRLALKALEAGEEGQPHLDTHTHNTEVTLGGLTYARVIEIINGYTITFEDGQWAVNLVGANSNVADVVNVNQVSVRSANSAGLISSPDIEYASYENGVTYDSTSSTVGTTHPAGTRRDPVNNMADAMVIAAYRGLGIIYVIGDLHLNSGGNYSNMVFVGESVTKTTIDIDSSANVVNAEFYEATVEGTLDGNAKLKNCRILDLDYIYGVIERCMLGPGTITLGGSEEAHFLDCWCGTVAAGLMPIIDCGGSGQGLAVRNYNGCLKLTNKNGSDLASVDLNVGHVELASSIVLSASNQVVIRGIGTLTDNSTGAAAANISTLINVESITKSFWDTIWVDTVSGESGTAFPLGTRGAPVDNMADAKAIAQAYGISKFYLHNAVTLTGDWSGFSFEASSYDACTITCDNTTLTDTTFKNCGVSGSMASGNITGDNIMFASGFTGLKADLENSQFKGAFTIIDYLKGDRCTSEIGCNIDLSGSATLAMANFSGVMTVANCSNPAQTIGFTGTYVLTLASSCTAGIAMIAGIGIFTDNSAGTTLIERTLPSKTWAEPLATHADVPGSAAEAVEGMRKINQNRKVLDEANSQLVVYENNGTTEWKRFDLKDAGGDPVVDGEVYESVPIP